MGVAQQKVVVHDLEVGMFVSTLDRPWHQTPFPIQGFHIRSESDIRDLVRHCKWVIIDVEEKRESAAVRGTSGSAVRHRRSQQDAEVVQLPPLRVREPVTYRVTATLRKEARSSGRLLKDAEAAITKTCEAIREGHQPDLRPVAEVARKMVESVARNPDALLWLSRIRQHDDYTYQHGLNSAVWALVCGRELGLNEDLLNHLGFGVLMSQVGKTLLPASLLRNEYSLSSDELEQFRGYVEESVRILEQCNASRAVIGVARYHRERHNGSGFPRGIKGDRIPLLAKVAGLAEYYESLIAPRESGLPMAPADAVRQLFKLRNIEFQEDLVEIFIQAIGIYPTGSLVELSDGQRGVVLSHVAERRLWPRVMVMTDRNQQPLKSARVIDLARYNENRAASETLTIAGCLPHGTEGLNPAHFDVTGTESRWQLKRLIGG